MKARRQAVILDVIREQQVRSQEQLRRQMRGAGFDVTQATLSRDIRELGLVKGGPNGAYQAPPRDETNGQTPAAVFQRALGSQLRRIDRVQQLVLLRTGTRACAVAVRAARRCGAPGRGRDARW
jgi:transcriptional regulator of arginine metabolism